MEKNINNYFMELIPDEGCVLTDWNGKDILEYNSYTIVCAPLNTDFRVFKEISIEDDERYKAEYDKALQEKENTYLQEEKEDKNGELG